jgi:TonB-dependent SusC/RagA subfamily outer membrane receptor
MTGLVLHALWVSALLGLAAAAAEPVARALRLPTRWVWAAALVGSVALVGWGLVPSEGPGASSAYPTSEAFPPASFVGDAAGPEAAGTRVPGVGWIDRLAGVPVLAAALAEGRLPALSPAFREQGARVFLAGWGAGSVLLLALLAGGALHHRRTRKRWPREEVLGHPVRMAPVGGPAVAGFLRPEILLPRWALELPEGDLHLLLRHEEEHRRARDPLLLGGASLLVALAPWNPLLWWQLGRLRDALEVDCDARVLGRIRRGPVDRRATLPARPYAELLLRVGSRITTRPRTLIPAPAPFVTPAIGGSRTQLERRLHAMRTHRPRPLLLAGAAGAVVLLATAACLADRPTPVEPADEGVQAAVPTPEPRTETRFLDLEVVEPEVEVPPPGGETGAPRIIGFYPAPPGADVEDFEARDEGVSPLGDEEFAARYDGVRPLAEVRLNQDISTNDPAPLMIVDGVILSNAATLQDNRIDALDIAAIEVIKGEAARALYGSRAAAGVISITTHAGAERRTRNPPPEPPTPPGGH